jgi:hypothetical protein
MKNLILLILLSFGISAAFAQPGTNRFFGFQSRMYNPDGTPHELQLENATKARTGAFLKNATNGKTEFAYAVDTFYIRHDTAFFRLNGLHYYKLPPAPISSLNGNQFEKRGADSVIWIKDSLYAPFGSTGGIGEEIDSLSVHLADSANMLLPYMRKVDTTGMLANYKHWTAGYLTTSAANALYSVLGHTHTFASLTSKPTTISGYGITDAQKIQKRVNINYESDPTVVVDSHDGNFFMLRSNTLVDGLDIQIQPNTNNALIYDGYHIGGEITIVFIPANTPYDVDGTVIATNAILRLDGGVTYNNLTFRQGEILKLKFTGFPEYRWVLASRYIGGIDANIPTLSSILDNDSGAGGVAASSDITVNNATVTNLDASDHVFAGTKVYAPLVTADKLNLLAADSAAVPTNMAFIGADGFLYKAAVPSGGGADLSNYYTQAQVDSAIAANALNYVSKTATITQTIQSGLTLPDSLQISGRNTGSTSTANINLYDYSGNLGMQLRRNGGVGGFGQVGVTDGKLLLDAFGAYPIEMGTNGTKRFFMTSTGEAIFNTTAAGGTSDKLQVAGDIKVTGVVKIGSDTAATKAEVRAVSGGSGSSWQTDSSYFNAAHVLTQGRNKAIDDSIKAVTAAALAAEAATARAAEAVKLNIADYIVGDTPTGTINGINATFTLANTPVTNKEIIHLNGIRQKRTVDYTISGATITMINIPETGDELIADYLK